MVKRWASGYFCTVVHSTGWTLSPQLCWEKCVEGDTPAHASRHCITFWWNIVLSGCSYISHYNPVRVDFIFSSCRNCIRSSNHQTHASGVLWFYFGWPWVYPVLTVCHAGHAALKTYQGTVTIHARPSLSMGLVANTYWPAALQRKSLTALNHEPLLFFSSCWRLMLKRLFSPQWNKHVMLHFSSCWTCIEINFALSVQFTQCFIVDTTFKTTLSTFLYLCYSYITLTIILQLSLAYATVSCVQQM